MTVSYAPPRAAPTETKTPAPSIFTSAIFKPARTCTPTLDNGISPSFVPGAPARTVVGKGHVVTGVVHSSADCRLIAHARLEFRPEEEGLAHPDSSRAAFFTDQKCNLPDHIHIRISADGYKTIGVNSYHPNGQAEGTSISCCNLKKKDLMESCDRDHVTPLGFLNPISLHSRDCYSFGVVFIPTLNQSP